MSARTVGELANEVEYHLVASADTDAEAIHNLAEMAKRIVAMWRDVDPTIGPLLHPRQIEARGQLSLLSDAS